MCQLEVLLLLLFWFYLVYGLLCFNLVLLVNMFTEFLMKLEIGRHLLFLIRSRFITYIDIVYGINNYKIMQFCGLLNLYSI